MTDVSAGLSYRAHLSSVRISSIAAAVILASAALLIVFAPSSGDLRLVSLGCASGLCLIVFMMWLRGLVHYVRAELALSAAKKIILLNQNPTLISNAEGVIIAFNTTAFQEFAANRGDQLRDVLHPSFLDIDALLSCGFRGSLKGSDGEASSILSSRWRATAEHFEGPFWIWQLARLNEPTEITVEASNTISRDGAADRIELPAVTVNSFEDAVDGLPVPLLKIARDGTIYSANSHARNLLGVSEGDIPPLYELVEGMGRPISDWLEDAGSGRGLMKPEFVRATLPENELFLQITLGRVEGAEEPYLFGILNDATELKTLEAQFVQSQKMQAIGQLAGGVAHDFNNLLTAINGHCDLLLLRHDEGDPDYSDLMQIAQNANRAASLVGQLLAFSRKQNLRSEALDLRDVMSDLTHLLNRLVGEKISLDLQIERMEKVIRADPRQFEQVIMNLIVNARDAMPDGGTVKVKVYLEKLEQDLSRDRATVPAGNYIVIKVIDEGVGIDRDKLPKIFEPFFTTKKTGEGTGLGLSTVYGIVKQTGGFIFAESRTGDGTCFSLYFPALDKVVEAKTQPPESRRVANTRHGDGVILLVEDEAPVRAFASRALRLRGYTVLEAENAEEALETLQDETLKIDVFVTDVIMPGLDGPSWVKQALDERPDTRVVFVSGYAEESLAENQARIPNSVFLAKPFSLTDLTTVVHDQLQ